MILARQTARTLAELDDSMSAREVELWALLMSVEHEEAVKAAQDRTRGGVKNGRGFK